MDRATPAELFQRAMECAARADEIGATFGPTDGLLMLGYAQLADFYLKAIDVVHNYGKAVTG